MATFYTVGGKNYTLASSISSTATSITLTSFTLPITDQAITMATANTSIMYGTLQPGTTNSEFISFTGITQNSDGTATLTGVTRGLDREYPYTEASAFKLPHPGQSIFILSDLPQLFNSYTAKVNDETIAGEWTFPAGGNANAPKSGSSYSAPTDDLEYVSKKYADDLAIAGSPKATESVYGITKLSVAAASATDPIAVGTNDTRMPTQGENDALVGTSGTPSSSNKYVTNDDTSATAAASKVVRANSTGLVDYSFLESLLFGDGSDGDVTISSNTSLSRDMYYNNLTINSGFTLNPSGYRIFVKGTLTTVGSGKIVRDGNNGTAGTGAAGGTGGSALSAGTIAGGVAGGNGGYTGAAGSSGGSVTNAIGTTTTAGAGGAGNGGPAGGTGGTTTVASPTIITPKLPIQLSSINLFNVTGLFNNTGSGGGGGSSTNNGGYRGGGGGGSAGGLVAIYANSIVFSATNSVSVIGGNGGNGGSGGGLGDGGGGGGGNGGTIVLVYKSISGTSLTAASACAGGSAGTGANSGTAGSTGTIYSYLIS